MKLCVNRMQTTLALADSLNAFGEKLSATQFLCEVDAMLALPQTEMAKKVLRAKRNQLQYELETWAKLSEQKAGAQ